MPNSPMDKYEQRRNRLLALVTTLGYGGRATVAKAIGKSPDYISRMLYPPGKPGYKRIGEDTADLISAAYPHWLDTVLRAEEARPAGLIAAISGAQGSWPFQSITPAEWTRIPAATRHTLEQQIKALVPDPASEKRAA